MGWVEKFREKVKKMDQFREEIKEMKPIEIKEEYNPSVKIVNLTPHPVVIYMWNEQTGYLEPFEFPPSGIVARCEEKVLKKCYTLYNVTISGIPELHAFDWEEKTIGNVVNLPPPKPNTIYIVSMAVAQAVGKEREDVFCIGETVRDEKGRIIGAKSLARIV